MTKYAIKLKNTPGATIRECRMALEQIGLTEVRGKGNITIVDLSV